MSADAPVPTAIYAEAYKLAKQGLGWEDIWVRLRAFGLTQKAARIIVLGKKRP